MVAMKGTGFYGMSLVGMEQFLKSFMPGTSLLSSNNIGLLVQKQMLF
jgi:hypothetical protein